MRKVKTVNDKMTRNEVPYPEPGIPRDMQSDLMILAQTILGEAEGEMCDGKLAVGFTIVNRSKDSRWPDRVGDVCLQRLQFSAWNAGSPRVPVMMNPKRRASLMIWRDCWRAATAAFFGLSCDPTGGANHYLVSEIQSSTYWARDENPTAIIGDHSFFRL